MNDKALYESLVLVRNAPNLAPVVEMLKGDRDKCRDHLETVKGDAVLQEQGKAQYIKELLGRIESAPITLEKLQHQRRP